MDAFKNAAWRVARAAERCRNAWRNPNARGGAFQKFLGLFPSLAPALLLLALLAAAGGTAVGGQLRPLTQPVGETRAKAPSVSAQADGTFVLRLELSQAVDFQPFVLKAEGAKSDRVVLDLSAVRWTTYDVGGMPTPEVRSLRFGLFHSGRSRVVVDLAAPGDIVSATMTPSADASAVLELRFRVGSLARFDSGAETYETATIPHQYVTTPAPVEKPASIPPTWAPLPVRDPRTLYRAPISPTPTPAPSYAPRYDGGYQTPQDAASYDPIAAGEYPTASIELKSRRASSAGLATVPPTQAPRPVRRPLARDAVAHRAPARQAPVIVIDPGHGGKDSGAVYGKMYEKDLVLSLAHELRKRLHRQGYMHVYLTRTGDTFLELPERVEIARKQDAALFISLHADSLPHHGHVSGASIYTLTPKGSKRVAHSMARDRSAPGSEDLFDLPLETRRQIAETVGGMLEHEAQKMAALFIHEFNAKGLSLIPSRPHRQADFRVLKNFDAPSVLIEVGFLTNAHDRRRFQDPTWRAATVDAIARAVQRWIARDY